MNPSSTRREPMFVVATPARSPVDPNAVALHHHGLLRFVALGTRRGIDGIPPEQTRLNPLIGLTSFIAAKLVSVSRWESFRFRLHPWFDAWVKRQLIPGDHLISSYGYANNSFKWVRANGGKTFLDGGNSHPDNYWTILSEEHRRWGSPHPPTPPHHYRRAMAMMEHVDYVMAPSSFVANSFLARGFKPEQIIRNPYPVNIRCFTPAREPRPASRPLTLISTGSLSLRKGTPYLLEAYALVRRRIPNARLLLTHGIQDNVRPVLEKYRDLPIEWAPALPHPELAARLQSADLFILPSLEEGLVRTALEAMACGLPVILTPNTGTSDFVRPGINGEVVPIRDAQAIADAVFKWADQILAPGWQPTERTDTSLLSFENFEKGYLAQLRAKGFAPAPPA